MRFEYDQTADALYVRLVDEGMVDRTVELDTGTLVDVDSSGNALGIEIIRPARRVPVEEIAERFHLEDAPRLALLGLWGDPADRFPYEPAELAVG